MLGLGLPDVCLVFVNDFAGVAEYQRQWHVNSEQQPEEEHHGVTQDPAPVQTGDAASNKGAMRQNTRAREREQRSNPLQHTVANLAAAYTEKQSERLQTPPSTIRPVNTKGSAKMANTAS